MLRDLDRAEELGQQIGTFFEEYALDQEEATAKARRREGSGRGGGYWLAGARDPEEGVNRAGDRRWRRTPLWRIMSGSLGHSCEEMVMCRPHSQRSSPHTRTCARSPANRRLICRRCPTWPTRSSCNWPTRPTPTRSTSSRFSTSSLSRPRTQVGCTRGCRKLCG